MSSGRIALLASLIALLGVDGSASAFMCEEPEDCPTVLEITSEGSDEVFDIGWSGHMHEKEFISDAKLSFGLTSCDNASPPCGTCSISGAVPNTSGIANRRCTNATYTQCTTDGDCSGGGKCALFFGSYTSVEGDNVVCQSLRLTGSVTGTANVESGAIALTLPLLRTTYTQYMCPLCTGDATPNDGVADGTCVSGSRDGQSCDANGEHENAHLGATSLDCPPTNSSVYTQRFTVSPSTGTQIKALSTASPNCRATGYTSLKCFCDTCDNPAATPCSSNADCGSRCRAGSNAGAACTTGSECPSSACIGGTTCGGKRCAAGANSGAPCSVNSQCPSSTCLAPGNTRPNECDGTQPCTPTGDNRGKCDDGPVDYYCEPNSPFKICTDDSHCSDVSAIAVGRCVGGSTPGQPCDNSCGGGGSCEAQLKSCLGGTNALAICLDSSECPSGSCEFDTCTMAETRNCFVDDGLIDGAIKAEGSAGVPVNGESTATLAAVFCVPHSTSTIWNGHEGTPGPGRMHLPVHASFLP